MGPPVRRFRLDGPPDAKWAKAHQFGWLRRPELDKPGQFVWERPDGSLFVNSSDKEPEIMFVPRTQFLG